MKTVATDEAPISPDAPHARTGVAADAMRVGAVVIGRNEGERLRRCLMSLQGHVACVVYVDSGSTDGSVQAAQDAGAQVVALDMTQPFTAARARNAGFARLKQVWPEVRLVQFVDGDCEVHPAWVDRALAHLKEHPKAVAVCGQRRERHPERSIYNQLCDLEWAKPAGIVDAFGGDVMIRAAALSAVGGYREDLIAGEEPELCVRLRRQGGEIHAVAHDMTLHDAAMTSFSQWWKRMVRSGYAYAAGAWLHGAAPERHWVRERRRTWVWGAGPLLLTVVMAPFVGAWALLVLLVYPLKLARQVWRSQQPWPRRFWQALFNDLARFPEMAGQWRFLRDRWTGRDMTLIEYK